MNPRQASRRASLRTQLAAAALAGLVTTGAMTLLLLQTASTAREAMLTARGAHERVQNYSRLEYAAREFETSSFAAIRSDSPQAAQDFANNEKRYRAALIEANALPRRDAREQAIGETVRRQADAVLTHYQNSAQIVREVDDRWRSHGSKAALMEVDRQGAPYFALEKTLEAEIRLSDRQMAEATARALTMTQVAAPASLAGLVMAIGFSAIVFVLLLTRLGPSLRRLEEGARAFGAGDLSERIGLSGGDELAQLSAAFDSMAGQLAEKQADLQAIHAGLERAVAARTHELESANAALSAEDGRRRAFLADVSHELRTPLTIIRGEAQVALRMADSGKLDPIEVFERILQQTRDLSRMVDDLFVIARAEAGGLRLQRQTMDLAGQAARVAADFEAVASERGSTIRAEAGAAAPAYCDPDRVRQALAALVDNALRHTPCGAAVTVSAGRDGDGVFLAVADDGPGIDPDTVEQLFGRFRRGETRGEGSGLGLTLVRALAEAHGGAAYLENAPGGGARAVLKLPAGAPVETDEAA